MVDLRKQLSIGLAHLAYAAYRLDVFRTYEWLKQAEQWPAATRREWQLERLNKILSFTWDNVPFYRDFWSSHGVHQRTLRDLEELLAYPVLRKETFRENWKSVRPATVDSIPHIPKHTGGTTGRPVHYLLDKKQWTLMQAFLFWGWSLTGYSFGDPIGVLTGGSLMPERVTSFERVRNFIERRLFLFGVQMDRNLAVECHNKLKDYGARFLYGYPSILHLFCRYLKEEGLQLPDVRAVVTTAEMLQPHYRQGIESTLGCKVFDDYGCNDGGFESFECRFHCGFHYNDYQSILEVEENDGKRGGTLLVTNLWNRSTPFIRYENGDTVCLAADKCSCGSGFPLIGAVEGRTADILTFGNGQSFVCPPHMFGDMDIDGWQIVQTDPLRVEVRMAKRGSMNPAYMLKVNRVLRHHLNEQIAVEVKQVEKLTTTKGGKLKPVWSEVGARQDAVCTAQ